MIQFSCPDCKQLLQIPEEYAGQQGTCKHCQSKITVPALAGDMLVDVTTSKKRPSWLPYAIGALGVILISGGFALVRSIGSPTESVQQTPLATVAESAPTPSRPKSHQEQIKDAQQLAIQGKYREAIQAFEKVRTENPRAIESIHGLHFAAVYTTLGDHDGHERLCRWLFSSYGQPKIAKDAGRTAKAYLLNPGASNQELLRQAAENGRIGVEGDVKGMMGWRQITRGMGEYRIGNYKEAASWIERSVNHENPQVRSLANTFLAMAEYKLNNIEKANGLLEEARNQISAFPKLGSEEYAAGWVDYLIPGMSLEEAEALFGLTGAVANSPKDQLKDAQQLANQGKYREAIQAFERIRIENPDAIEAIDGLHIATVYAVLDDHAGHLQLCKWLTERYAQSSETTDRERAAKAYLLYAGADDEELLSRAEKLTNYAVTNETGWALPWFQIAHGMANYRLKRYSEASTWLKKSIGHKNPLLRSQALAYSALTEFAQGNEESARNFMQQAKDAVAGLPEKDWRDAEVTKLALKEAGGLLKMASSQLSVDAEPVEYLPAKNLESFTVFTWDHGVGNDPDETFKLVDGVLVANGSEQGFLFTNEAYENYRLEVDYKWLTDRPDRDSGIFVNIMGREGKELEPSNKVPAIEVNILGPGEGPRKNLSGQIWLFSPQGDDVNLTVDGQVYTKRTSPPGPTVDLENPIGEWNTMEITNANGKFLVKLNGKVAVDATDPFPSRGRIVLQASRGEIHFGRMTLTSLE